LDIKTVSRQSSVMLLRWSFTKIAYEAHEVALEQCEKRGYVADMEALDDFPERPDWSRLRLARRVYDRALSAYHASLLDED
jgi:hypothetical protein